MFAIVLNIHNINTFDDSTIFIIALITRISIIKISLLFKQCFIRHVKNDIIAKYRYI